MVAQKPPRASILIPTYNRDGMVSRAIRSVLEQTGQDFELIVVDDGSTDDTAKVVKSFNDHRLYYIRHDQNRGLLAARNTGLKAARGEYIAILDDDDFWIDEDKLKKQVEFLDAHPDYVLVGTNQIVIDEKGTELFRSSLPEKDDEIRGKLLEQNYFVHSSVIYRKSAAMLFGGYGPVQGTPNCDEYDLWLKLGTVGKFSNLPIYGVKRTIWPGFFGNINAKGRITLCVSDIKLIGKYKDKYPHYGQALRFRYVQFLSVLLSIVINIPPFSYLKRFLKNKCPACWRTITRVHSAVFQGILYILYVLSKLHK